MPLQRMRHAPLLCLVVALLYPNAALTYAADAPPTFEAQQQAAAAQNPSGVTCALQTEGGKTRFQMGELIHVTASFAAATPGYKLSPFYQSRPSLLSFGTFFVSPRVGVADPLGDLPPQQAIIVNGYVPDPVPLSDKPYKMTMLLNEWVRFDQPGHYRCYLTTRRVFASKPGNKDDAVLFGNKATAPVTSNILELDLEPDTPGWAEEQVRQALRQLNGAAGKQLFPELGWGQPAEVLRYLETRAAAQAMIERMGQDTRPRSAPVEAAEYYMGLIGFPERDWAIAQMQKALARSDYPVTQEFLQTLALLHALQIVRPPAMPQTAGEQLLVVPPPESNAFTSAALPKQRIRDWSQRLYAAQSKFLNSSWHDVAASITPKSGYARAMTLHSLLELAWLDRALGSDTKAQARVPQLIGLLAPVLDRLPPVPLQYLLEDEWVRIRSHAMLPALQRLWAAAKPPTGGEHPEVAAMVLRRINELDPQVGRHLILQEIQRPKLRVEASALGILPDASIPSLDKMLSVKLLTAQDYDELDIICYLIGRYGSPTLLRQAQQFYEPDADAMNCALKGSLLAYFLRVDPPYGIRMIKRALAARKQTGCYQSVLVLIAAVHMTPALEKLAIATLHDPSPDVVAETAGMLKEYGSPAAKTALWNRLKQESTAPKPNQRIEYALAEALEQARHWRLNMTTLRQVQALVHAAAGRGNLNAQISSRSQSWQKQKTRCARGFKPLPRRMA